MPGGGRAPDPQRWDPERYKREGGRFSAGAAVQTDKTKPALLELHKELIALHTGSSPVTAAELDRERLGAILSLPARFATSREALARFQSLVYYDLPLEYYESYVDKIASVTLDQVTAAAEAHLEPADARAIVVGDGAIIQRELLELTAQRALGDGNLV